MVELIITLVFIYASAYIDNEHLIDGDYIEDHTSRWILRFVFILAVGNLDWKITLGCGLIFAAVFDQVLNAVRKEKTFHLGSTSPWDKFWRKHMVLYKIMSLLSLIGGVLLCQVWKVFLN